MLPLLANASTVEINGIYYNLIYETKVAEVTSNPSKYTGDITIPESVEYNSITYSVTSIGEYNQEIKGKTNVEIIPVST